MLFFKFVHQPQFTAAVLPTTVFKEPLVLLTLVLQNFVLMNHHLIIYILNEPFEHNTAAVN